jgi:CMP-N-acetylneuraminic acid synthetase
MSKAAPGAQRVLGLIPAKGASTRLPRKNVRPLGGRPLIEWTIEAARQASLFDRVVVSTEDAEVAALARAAGAEVPFERPRDLAVDPAGVVQVALHALEALQAQGATFDVICIMLPTCPFRTAGDIRAAFERFRSRPEPNLMSVSAFEHTPFNAVGIDGGGLLFPHCPERFGGKSQQQPAAFRPNGALHILDVAWFQKSRSYHAPQVIAYEMPRERSLDIDSEADLVEAESLLSAGVVSRPGRVHA